MGERLVVTQHSDQTLDWNAVRAYRARTYRLLPELRVETKDEAVAFVNDRGFVMFRPIKGIDAPNLWSAVAGDRPVPNRHDDPGHVTWAWKDELLDERRWYYGKILRRRATILSLDLAPAFYALSENYGSPESDYVDQYQAGRMSQEARIIYETLLERGALDAVALRKATGMVDDSSRYRFNRGLTELQGDFKVLPIGVAEAGAWNYAFIYECVHRYYLELPTQARSIKIGEAHRMLVMRYLASVGAIPVSDVEKLFGWSTRDVERAIEKLAAEGALIQGLTVADKRVADKRGTWIALPALI
jgi:hypothetical protein